MKTADHTNFVTVLSEEKPAMIFFYYKAEESQANKIKQDIDSICLDLPLLPAYEYVIDDSAENHTLAEFVGVTKTPIIVFFKAGNFHRFKNKKFTKASIVEFIGHSKPYKEPETEKVAKPAKAKKQKM
jgi:hypothetical protein